MGYKEKVRENTKSELGYKEKVRENTKSWDIRRRLGRILRIGI